MTNALTRWNPLQELEEFQNRVLSAFNPGLSRRGNGQESLTMAEWMPVVDISEDDQEYVITAELPEVKKEDVRVTVESRVARPGSSVRANFNPQPTFQEPSPGTFHLNRTPPARELSKSHRFSPNHETKQTSMTL